MNRLKILSGLVVTLLLGGCHVPSSDQTDDTDEPPDSNSDSESSTSSTELASLVERTFVAKEILRNGIAEPLLTGTMFEVRFGEDGVFYAFGGCNSIRFPIVMDENALFVETIDIYMVSCGEYLDAQVEMFIAFLESDPVVTTDGDRLILDGHPGVDEVRIEFVDAATVSPNLILEGTRWEVDQYLIDDIVVSDGWTTTATVAFQEDGVVAFHTGCNSGTGTYQVDGDQVRFSDVTRTEEACPTPQDEIQESVVLSILTCDGPVDWEVTWTEGDRLSLRAMEIGIYGVPFWEI
jgi:heat shock protein HslJ